jgi:ACS family D-galactonate transporter-like MFS transporter
MNDLFRVGRDRERKSGVFCPSPEVDSDGMILPENPGRSAGCDSQQRNTAISPEPRVDRRRWRIAFLLGLGVLVNYFDRVNLSVAHDALITSFAISNVTFGYLSAAYVWTFALCQLPIGVLLDKFGVRIVGRISTFVWSIASFAAAVAPTLGGLFVARLLLGIGEAPTFPANAKAIGSWFPAHELSLATAIFDSAAKFASAIGVPLMGILLLRIGWRYSFAVTGLLSFLYFLLFYRVYRDPARDRAHTLALGAAIAVRIQHPQNAALGYLVRQPKVIGVALGFGSHTYTIYLLLTWLPSYLSSALHIDLLHSFLYTGVPWFIGAICEMLVGGWLIGRLIGLGWNADRVRRGVLVVGTTMGLGILGAAHARSATQALLWISISLAGISVGAPVVWSLPSLIAPRGSVGTLGGTMNFCGQISGIVAPIATGYLVNARHSFAWAFGVAAIYLLLGILAYVFLLGRIEQIPVQPYFGEQAGRLS